MKLVYCVERDEYFKNTSEAARSLSINAGSIWKVLNGINKRAGGYTFVYKEMKDSPTYLKREIQYLINLIATTDSSEAAIQAYRKLEEAEMRKTIDLNSFEVLTGLKGVN